MSPKILHTSHIHGIVAAKSCIVAETVCKTADSVRKSLLLLARKYLPYPRCQKAEKMNRPTSACMLTVHFIFPTPHRHWDMWFLHIYPLSKRRPDLTNSFMGQFIFDQGWHILVHLKLSMVRLMKSGVAVITYFMALSRYREGMEYHSHVLYAWQVRSRSPIDIPGVSHCWAVYIASFK